MEQDNRKEFYHKVLAIVICSIIFLVSLGASSMIHKSYAKRAESARLSMSEQYNKLATLKASQKNDENAVNEEMTGLDKLRVERDDKACEKFIKSVTTWSSSAEYKAARSDVIKKYKISESSSFLTQFMPEVSDFKAGGLTFNEIDSKKINMLFTSMKSTVLSIDGDTYTYYTVVTVGSSNNKGATVSNDVAFIYSTNSDHQILSVEAYTLLK